MKTKASITHPLDRGERLVRLIHKAEKFLKVAS